MSVLSQILKLYPGDPEKVKVNNLEETELKLASIMKEGAPTLQVIMDFDFTLTKFKTSDGLRCVSSHGIIDNSPLLPEELRKKLAESLAKYYPIEIDHEMTVEEKIPHIVEWYELCHVRLVEYGFAKSNIKEMVASSRAFLRDNAKLVLSKLNEARVPVLLFSAGIGNLLEEVLTREEAFYPNIKVVSNYMEFDESGIIKTFKAPLIHMFNKNETALSHSGYFDELGHRGNALVLGDSLGDAHMSDGMPNSKHVLKIGFLNDKIEERMESFLAAFDIVLVDDQSFDFIDALLRIVLQNTGH